MDKSLRKFRFHGLYHVPDHAEHHANLGKVRDSVSIYLRCASLCSESFQHAGYDFTLVTNQVDFLRRRLLAQNLPSMNMIEKSYETKLERGSPFYSAHFKLDLLRDFATGNFGEHIGLVDIDTVLLRPFSLNPPETGLVAYNLNAQVKPARRGDIIDSDIRRLVGAPISNATWWGGEFIAGSTSSFSLLKDKLDWLWPRYLTLCSELHHVGDEIVTTAGLAMAISDGMEIEDAGKTGGVARWWSSRTLTQHPSLREISDRSLIHLPADKKFLSRMAGKPFCPKDFLIHYESAIRGKLAIRRAATFIEKLSGNTAPKVPPRIR